MRNSTSLWRIRKGEGHTFPLGFADELAVVRGLPARESSLLVFSIDAAVIGIATAAVPLSWRIEVCRDRPIARAVLSQPGLRVAVIDDDGTDDATLDWLFERIHRSAPQTLVVYIASSHSAHVERRARALGVQYYTAKPLDRDRTVRVLRSFARAGE